MVCPGFSNRLAPPLPVTVNLAVLGPLSLSGPNLESVQRRTSSVGPPMAVLFLCGEGTARRTSGSRTQRSRARRPRYTTCPPAYLDRLHCTAPHSSLSPFPRSFPNGQKVNAPAARPREPSPHRHYLRLILPRHRPPHRTASFLLIRRRSA